MSDLFSKENLERLRALAADAAAAKRELLGLPSGSAPHLQESLCRRIERFECVMNPAMTLELLTRMEEVQALADRAISTVERMNNHAIHLQQLVTESMEKLGQFSGGSS